MAASEETCAGNPNFAVICSFITNFGNDCGVNISIPYLQEMLEDTKTVHQDLLEILLHLMRRGKKRVNKEKWEKSLIKFCHEYSSVDAWEIERFGFLKSKLSVKLELLKRLLELQFDANAKFKAEVNKHDAAKLRLLPIGRDIDGHAYWYQLDKDYNMRLYLETVGEESSWQLMCSTTEDLKTLIASLEKKYSCPGSDASEDKLNDPKSPSSDMPVPKKEQDCEEMTSCLSESKPCTIIIKTEKKESSDTTVKSENCAITAESENSVSDNNTKGSVKLKLKLESSSNSNSEQNSYSIVSETCAIGAVDTESAKMDIDKPTEDTKNVTSNDSEVKNSEQLSTNEVDKATVNAKNVLNSDIEMKNVENLSTNDTEIKNIEKSSTNDIEMENVEKLSSNNIEMKNVENLSTNNIEMKNVENLSTNNIEMKNVENVSTNDVDETVVNAKGVLSNDIEMKNVDKLSSNDTNSQKLIKEHSDQNIPNNSKSDADVEKSDSVQHKSSKIKLYEKWSNEKRKLDAADANVKESSSISKNMPDSKEQPECLVVNKINKPAIPAKIIPEQSIKDPKSSIEDQNLSSDPDVAVDLSKSSRVNVIVQNTNSKPLCSNDVPPSLKSKTENGITKSDINSNNLKAIKNSEQSSEKATDLKKRSDSGSEKAFGRNSMLSGYYDVPRISDTSSTSGFSHLQALQNMCETNSMGGIQSVIQSTNRLKSESNKTVISENKSVSNTIICENINKKYNFNELHASTKNDSSDHEASNILLKSNVHIKNDIDKQNIKFLDKSDLSNFKESISNESNKSKEQPEDLSSQTTSKSKNSESKTDLKCDLDENSSSANIEKHPVNLKTVSEMDEKNENSSDKNCASLIGKDLDAPKLSPCSNECNSLENNVCQSESPKLNISSPKSEKSKDPSPKEVIKELESGETVKPCSKSTVQCTEIDASNNLSKSKKLKDDECLDSGEEKMISESSKKLHKCIDKDKETCTSNIQAPEKLLKESKSDSSSSAKETSLTSSDLLLKDSERKFSVFSKPSTNMNDSVSYEITEVKIPTEIKISEEFGSESKDSLGGPPDLKESYNSVDLASEEYKPSPLSNENSVSEPPPLLKEELKTPVKDDISSVFTEVSKKDNIRDEQSIQHHFDSVDGEKKKTDANEIESTKISNVDEDKSPTHDESNVSKKDDKKDEIINTVVIEKEVAKSEGSLEFFETKDLNKSKKTKSEENLKDKNAESDSDVSSITKSKKKKPEENLKDKNADSNVFEKSKKDDKKDEIINAVVIEKEVEKSEASLESFETKDLTNSKKTKSEENLKDKNADSDSDVSRITKSKKNKPKENLKDKNADSKSDAFKNTKSKKKNPEENLDADSESDTVKIEISESDKKNSGSASKVSVSDSLISSKEVTDDNEKKVENKHNEEKGNIVQLYEKDNAQSKVEPDCTEDKVLKTESNCDSNVSSNIEKPDLKDSCENTSSEKVSKEVKVTGNKSPEHSKDEDIVLKVDENSKSKKDKLNENDKNSESEKDKLNETDKNSESKKDNLNETDKNSESKKDKLNETDKNSESKKDKLNETDKKSRSKKGKLNETDKKSRSKKDKLNEIDENSESKEDKLNETDKNSESKKDNLNETNKNSESKKNKLNETDKKSGSKKDKLNETNKKSGSKKDKLNEIDENSESKEDKLNETDKKSGSKKDKLNEIDEDSESKEDKLNETGKISESKEDKMNETDKNSESKEDKLNETDENSESKKDKLNETDENSESKKDKLNETSCSEKDIPVDSAENQAVLDEINSEESNKKPTKQTAPKKRGRKGRSNRWAPTKRRNRHSKAPHEEIEVIPQIDENTKEESKEHSVDSVDVDDSSSNKEKKTPVETSESTKSAINSEKSNEMLFKIYNLRHSICLEAKSKHPLCDKYVKSPAPVVCIDISNNDKVSPKKTRPKGRNAKQPVNKKPQPAPKPATPAKKTPPPPPPPSSSKKKTPARNQKKNEVQKDDFAIPEGFLEILDKETSGKKRKGAELKLALDSQNSSDNESGSRKRSRRIQEQHQKKMTELAVEMEREQRILEQLAKRSNSNKNNNKATPQKTPEKPNAKGPTPKNTPIKGTSTPPKTTKSPRAAAKVPTIIEEEDTLMEGRRTRKMNSRSKNLTRMTLMYEDESKDSNFSTSRETEKSKKKRRRKRNRKGNFKPWDLSSESSSSIEVFTEEEEEEPDEPLIFEVNEDEFACEEIDPNAEPVIVRRARTAKKTQAQDAEEECVNDDTPCQKCGKYDKPEWILLCDKCDKGYHTHCLIPPLMIVPDGDWFCQPCQHLSLCQCLHEELNKLEVILKQREREALRKQRLAYVGISLDNVLKPEKKEKSDESSKEDKEEEEEEKEEKVKEKENRRASRVEKADRVDRDARQSIDDERNEKLYGKRSVRARRNVNYQFKEYDELIFSALQEDMIEVPEEFKEEVGSEAGSDKSDKPFTAKLPPRKKRARRFTDFDSTEEEDSQDDYQGGSSDSEATAPPSSVSEQESGSGEEWRISKSSGGRRKTSQRKPQSSRRRRKRRGRGGDSSEEDWEDEVVEPEPYRPTTRRAAQKAVSYRELSESEEDEWGVPKRKESNKRRKASSSDSEASFKKKVSKKKRIRKWGSSESSEESEEKSMSSSGESEEEEDENEEESENEWEEDKKEHAKEKLRVKKKVLNSDEDEEEEPVKKEPAPKKKVKRVVSEESEEEEDEEESEEEEEEEDEEEESESEEESEEDEKRVKKKAPVPEKKVPATDKKINDTESKQVVEKKGPEKPSDVAEPSVKSVHKEESKLVTDKTEFEREVLVKKELCSVDIPLEPNKPTTAVIPVSEKTHPKTVRKEATKMVPCVIPYEKPPKGSQVFAPGDEVDNFSSKEGESLRPALSNRHPIHIPKQSAVYAPPPPSNSRIQYTGALPRHSVPPISSPMRPSIPPSNLQSRMPVPTNLSTRPTPTSVVMQHSSPSSRMPLRPPVPIGKSAPPPLSSAAPTVPPSKQTVPSKPEKPYKSTIMEPFSNMDDENESDDEVPLERIPTAVPVPSQNRPVSYEKDAEYRPAAKELSSFAYAPPEEKQYSGSYSTLSTFQDYSARPSPLKPSLVETYSNNSSPSKLTPLDSYSRTNSPKGFISLDSYSENKKKKHFYGNSSQEGEPSSHKVPPAPSENYQGGEIRFPPEPYPCPQSPSSFPQRSPPPPNQRDSGTPPRLYSQFPDAYAPPRSPEYYQNHQYYASEERIPRPSYQPNYVPPSPSEPPSFVSNPYVATPVPQPNGGFMIDTLLQARNPENEDELTGVTDIVSYITQE